MTRYNANSPMLGNATLNMKFNNYIAESFAAVRGTDYYESLFYHADIPKIDGKTGLRWVKTFKVAKPQGPGGFSEFSDDMFKGLATPGLNGIMVPNDQEYKLSTKFQIASIGRSFADKLNDNTGFYEAVKEASFGEHIREQQKEEIKKAIFTSGIKTYAGSAETEANVTTGLTWSELETLVNSVEDYEVQVIDNRQRVGGAFANAVKSITTTAVGESALTEPNVIDYTAFQAAQTAFEAAGLRTYRWATPRFLVGAHSTDAYNSTTVDGDITISTPGDYKDLFKQNNEHNSSPMVVFVSKEGYRQLWEDEEFLALLEVSGYQNEAGLSGRYANKHINGKKSVMCQGILIIDMGSDAIHGTLASEGIDYGKSTTGAGYKLDAALVATPGYNFITSSSDFGIRTTSKTTGQTDSIDRLGWQEWMYTLFTWDVQILTPSSFNLFIHAANPAVV